jgi:hypothetical protein
MRNTLDKTCKENQNIHFMFDNIFSENRAVYEIMSKNVVEPERPQMKTWRHVACWIIKATRAEAHARTRATPPPRARTHTHTQISNTYCICTATTVSRMVLNVTLYVRCPSL